VTEIIGEIDILNLENAADVFFLIKHYIGINKFKDFGRKYFIKRNKNY